MSSLIGPVLISDFGEGSNREFEKSKGGPHPLGSYALDALGGARTEAALGAVGGRGLRPTAEKFRLTSGQPTASTNQSTIRGTET
jgi:hypothetical protein